LTHYGLNIYTINGCDKYGSLGLDKLFNILTERLMETTEIKFVLYRVNDNGTMTDLMFHNSYSMWHGVLPRVVYEEQEK
jgi:hypothetical protein